MVRNIKMEKKTNQSILPQSQYYSLGRCNCASLIIVLYVKRFDNRDRKMNKSMHTVTSIIPHLAWVSNKTT